MAALIIERKTSKLSQDVLPSFPTNLGIGLAAAAKCFAGGMVARNAAGLAVAASAIAGQLTVGIAEKTVDNSSGIASALAIVPRQGCFLLNNSASTDLIAAANVGALCYVVDDNTVALTSAGGTRPIAGMVLDVDAGTPGQQGQPAGVWVLVGVLPGQSSGAPSTQAGTAVLVAGTKTVAAGISISASSVVVVSRKLQGGTVLNTIQYEELSGSRVVGAPGIGSLTFQASVAAGTVANTDTSTLEYLIVG